MRKDIEQQKKLGQIDISKIQIDLRCRDEIPKILLGLQHIYRKEELREKVFKILEEITPEDIDRNNGRPGMDLWRILVLGTVRLGCNWDYDKIHDIANNHQTIREMLGHSSIVDRHYKYALQTIKDNISLFTPKILNRINEIVVKEGHNFVKKNGEETLNGRCDSFVVKTNVHFPTDINLLFDAVRVALQKTKKLFKCLGLSGFRESKDQIRKLKKAYRKSQLAKQSTSKKKKVRQKKNEERIKAHQEYMDLSSKYINKVTEAVKGVATCQELTIKEKVSEINTFINHAHRQIDQIERRVINGETIPHNEKVFSLFEPHTEWISKGKAGVPQELGLRVCLLEDQHKFILHHHVMENETDEKVTVSMVNETKNQFPNLISCSFDKGFYSPLNIEKLKEQLRDVILPRKGRLSAKAKAEEGSEEFVRCKRQHSAVESAINGLEYTGLDICRDKGIDGFKRYVSLSVLSRNIHVLGAYIQEKQSALIIRREKIFKTWDKKRQTNLFNEQPRLQKTG